jgi:hypothetical protein
MLGKQMQPRRRFAPKRIKEIINILRDAGIPLSKIVVSPQGEMTFETGKPGENDETSMTPLEEWRAKRCGKG